MSQRDPSTTAGSFGRLRFLLRDRVAALVALAATSTAAGVTEAMFLALATRIAFALTDEADLIEAPFGLEVSLVGATGVLAVVLLLRVSFALAAAWQSANLSSGTAAALRDDLAVEFLRTSWPTQEAEGPGRLQELLTTFATTGTNLIASCASVIVNGANLLAMLVLAAFLDPLGTIVVAVAVSLLASILRPLRGAIRRQARALAGSGIAMSARLAELSQLGLEINSYAVRERVHDDIHVHIERHRRLGRKSSFLRAATPAIYTGLAYTVLVAALLVLINSENTSIETLGSILLVLVRALSYGQAVQNQAAQISAGLPFVEELEQTLDRYRSNAPIDGTQTLRSLNSIRLSDVHFSYDTRVPALIDVDLTVRRGEIVGLAGPSGGGKSTLVQVLLGLRSADQGRVELDGISIADIRRADLARVVAFVPQQPRLVSGTVWENIAFWRDVDEARIRRCAALAGILEEIEVHPDGFDRRIGVDGGHLSGGQAQRLCIARALVGDPGMLVLDEPTSALDPVSERLIRASLERIRSEAAVLVVAHRRSTLDVCDRVVVMEHGRIVADGPIAQLSNALHLQGTMEDDEDV